MILKILNWLFLLVWFYVLVFNIGYLRQVWMTG